MPYPDCRSSPAPASPMRTSSRGKTLASFIAQAGESFKADAPSAGPKERAARDRLFGGGFRPQRARQREELVLLGRRDRLDVKHKTLGKGAHDLLDDHLRRRGAGSDAQARDALEARPVDVAGALCQHRNRAALALGDLAQPLRV